MLAAKYIEMGSEKAEVSFIAKRKIMVMGVRKTMPAIDEAAGFLSKEPGEKKAKL